MFAPSRSWRSLLVITIVAASNVCFADEATQNSTQDSKTGAASGSPSQAGSGLQREYARLAQALNSSDTFAQNDAAETLLKVRPNDVANPETRKLIARGYRSLALESHGFGQEEAIRGLVI